MKTRARKRLVVNGFHMGDAADFLGLSDSERQLVEQRLETSRHSAPAEVDPKPSRGRNRPGRPKKPRRA